MRSLSATQVFVCYNCPRHRDLQSGGAEMLFIGRQQQRTCQTLTRRAFLQAGGSTVLGLSLADLLRVRARAETAGPAKSVLLLWLWGGPSQLDTWDPKPDA